MVPFFILRDFRFPTTIYYYYYYYCEKVFETTLLDPKIIEKSLPLLFFFLSIWPLADCLFGPFLWRFAFSKVAMSIVLAGNWKSYPTSDGFSASCFVSCSYRLAGNSSFTFWSLCLLICSVVLAWRRLSVALQWEKKRIILELSDFILQIRSIIVVVVSCTEHDFMYESLA